MAARELFQIKSFVPNGTNSYSKKILKNVTIVIFAAIFSSQPVIIFNFQKLQKSGKT